MERKETRKIKVGAIDIGGDAPIIVQSMTNTDTRDVDATISQIEALTEAGCELVRVAVPDQKAAGALKEIVAKSPIPVVADIHFHYQLALQALEAGVAKLRINPGNIGSMDKVRLIIKEARLARAAIRIGVNAGSLSPQSLAQAKGDTAEAMILSIEEHLRVLEEEGFRDIIVSLKSSDPLETIDVCRRFSERWDYPQHLGITEAGSRWSGTIRSAVGLGVLLFHGIGDTIRISLTGDPVDEVKAAYEILKALGLRERGPVIISCPTCGRCQIDLVRLVAAVEEATKDLSIPLRLAVMGCVVNGPGEARRADLGIAGGKDQGVIFREGKVIRKEREENLLPAFINELNNLLTSMKDHKEVL